MSALVAAVSVVAAAGWAFVRFRPSRVAIEGASMAPTLLSEDWVLVVRPRGFRRDDVVVAEHPERVGYEIVKRIRGVPGDVVELRVLGPDEWWIEGDYAQASTDSRTFGPVSLSHLKARVLLIYWPAGRRRMVR